jgi:hypothetical protein
VKNKLLLISLAVVLALSVGLIGCEGEGEGEGEGEAGSYTVYIGGGCPLTGPYPEDGKATLDAFQNYAQWVNANHKISPWGPTFPSNVKLEVKWMDDSADPTKALTTYNSIVITGTGSGLKMDRITGSSVGTAMKDTLYTDQVAATTQSSGPYVVSPRVGTIFSTYPIYTDQCAGIADWFMERWNATQPAGEDYVKPRVAYLTNASFGQTVPIPEMDAYLTEIGYEVVKPVQTVPVLPTGPADVSTQLMWCKDNNIDLTLGAMLIAGAVPTMTAADDMGIGYNLAYNMTIGLCSPAHLVVFLRETHGEVGNGLVIAGSYPPWTDTCDGVQFCKDLMNAYMTGGFKDTEHAMYQQGLAEAMIQAEALRLAMLNNPTKTPDELTSADILNDGFLKITDLDTGGILPTTATYGVGDVEAAEKVRLDQNQNGVDVHLGDWPLRHVY